MRRRSAKQKGGKYLRESSSSNSLPPSLPYTIHVLHNKYYKIMKQPVTPTFDKTKLQKQPGRALDVCSLALDCHPVGDRRSWGFRVASPTAGPPPLATGASAGGALPGHRQIRRLAWCRLADLPAPATKCPHVHGMHSLLIFFPLLSLHSLLLCSHHPTSMLSSPCLLASELICAPCRPPTIDIIAFLASELICQTCRAPPLPCFRSMCSLPTPLRF